MNDLKFYKISLNEHFIEHATEEQTIQIAKILNFKLPQKIVTKKCLCCENDIKFDYNNQFNKQEFNQTISTGCYGSYLDMASYEYFICNDCLKEKFDKGIIKEIGVENAD